MLTSSLRTLMAILVLHVAPAWSKDPVPLAAYQAAQEYFAGYKEEHGNLDRATLGQPYVVLWATYEGILAAGDAGQLLSTARVFEYDFPILCGGEPERVIMILPDRKTGEIRDKIGRGNHTLSRPDSVVWRLCQETRPREVYRFNIEQGNDAFIIMVDQRGDTLITPCSANGAKTLSMKRNASGQFPWVNLSDNIHLLKTYADELRAAGERQGD